MIWYAAAVVFSSQLGSLFPAHCSCDVAWGVIQGKKDLWGGKIHVSNPVIPWLNNFKITLNNRTYFFFVDKAHFCHIYGNVMLVGHDNLYFIHLEDRILKARVFLNECACGLIFYFTLFYWMLQKVMPSSRHSFPHLYYTATMLRVPKSLAIQYLYPYILKKHYKDLTRTLI